MFPRRQLLVLLGIVAVAVLAAVGVFTAWVAGALTPLPPLVASLPADGSTADLEFRHRVEMAFPEGATSPNHLVRQLEGQGFAVSDNSAVLQVSYGLACARTWVVLWKLDGEGTPRSIEGRQFIICP